MTIHRGDTVVTYGRAPSVETLVYRLTKGRGSAKLRLLTAGSELGALSIETAAPKLDWFAQAGYQTMKRDPWNWLIDYGLVEAAQKRGRRAAFYVTDLGALCLDRIDQ